MQSPYPSRLAHLTLAALGLAAGLAQAQFPLQNMGPQRLGMAYDFLTSGQDITRQNVGSQTSAHRLLIGYAPIPYAGLTLGLGIADFTTEPSDGLRPFEGRYGFSPSMGLRLATPAFVQEQLRVVGGATGQYLWNKDGQGLTYNTLVVDPDLGLQYSPFVFVDLGLGGRLHFVDGEIRSPRTANLSLFANEAVLRGYLSATVKTPAEGAFLTVDLDLSPSTDANWSRGPVEAAIHVTLGAVVGWRNREPKAVPRSPYFPNYRDLKERQEQMSDQLEAED